MLANGRHFLPTVNNSSRQPKCLANDDLLSRTAEFVRQRPTFLANAQHFSPTTNMFRQWTCFANSPNFPQTADIPHERPQCPTNGHTFSPTANIFRERPKGLADGQNVLRTANMSCERSKILANGQKFVCHISCNFHMSYISRSSSCISYKSVHIVLAFTLYQHQRTRVASDDKNSIR